MTVEMKISTFHLQYKSGNQLSATPLVDEESNIRMEAGGYVVALHSELSKYRHSVTVVQRRIQSLIRSPMPPPFLIHQNS